MSFDSPKVRCENVNWGIRHHSTYKCGNSPTYSCYFTNEGELLIVSLTKVFKYKYGSLTDSADIKTTAAVYIPEHRLLVGISVAGNRFVAYDVKYLHRVITDTVPSGQFAVFNIIYSSKSHTLITIGRNIKVWTLHYEAPASRQEFDAPTVWFTLRATFEENLQLSNLNPPCFDYEREYLFLPRKNGFWTVDLDGNSVDHITHYSSSPRIATDYFPGTQHFITADTFNGVCEWTKHGTLMRKHSLGQTKISIVKYIDEEFVLLVNGKNLMYIMDMGTGNVYFCDEIYAMPTTSGMFVLNNKQYFFLCVNTQVIMYTVQMPWKLWVSNSPYTMQIKRFEKELAAARLLILGNNSKINILSPKNGTFLSLISPSTSRSIINYIYERDSENELLITVHEGGKISIFETNTIPCRELNCYNFDAVSIVPFQIEDEKTYIITKNNGEVLIVDTEFRIMRRTVVKAGYCTHGIYQENGNFILMVYENQIIRFDIMKNVIKDSISVERGSLYDCHNFLLVIGYKTGRIEMIKMYQDRLDVISSGSGCIHSAPVTGFGFSSSFWCSVSEDCSLRLWNYECENITSISLPLPLYGVEVLNGKGDVVVGTQSELMLIPSELLFEEYIEQEDSMRDNYDRFVDELSAEPISEYQRELIKTAVEQSSFLQEYQSQMQLPGLKSNYSISSIQQSLRSFKDLDFSLRSNKSLKLELSEDDKRRALLEMNSLTDVANINPKKYLPDQQKEEKKVTQTKETKENTNKQNQNGEESNTEGKNENEKKESENNDENAEDQNSDNDSSISSPRSPKSPSSQKHSSKERRKVKRKTIDTSDLFKMANNLLKEENEDNNNEYAPRRKSTRRKKKKAAQNSESEEENKNKEQEQNDFNASSNVTRKERTNKRQRRRKQEDLFPEPTDDLLDDVFSHHQQQLNQETENKQQIFIQTNENNETNYEEVNENDELEPNDSNEIEDIQNDSFELENETDQIPKSNDNNDKYAIVENETIAINETKVNKAKANRQTRKRINVQDYNSPKAKEKSAFEPKQTSKSPLTKAPRRISKNQQKQNEFAPNEINNDQNIKNEFEIEINKINENTEGFSFPALYPQKPNSTSSYNENNSENHELTQINDIQIKNNNNEDTHHSNDLSQEHDFEIRGSFNSKSNENYTHNISENELKMDNIQENGSFNLNNNTSILVNKTINKSPKPKETKETQTIQPHEPTTPKQMKTSITKQNTNTNQEELPKPNIPINSINEITKPILQKPQHDRKLRKFASESYVQKPKIHKTNTPIYDRNAFAVPLVRDSKKLIAATQHSKSTNMTPKLVRSYSQRSTPQRHQFFIEPPEPSVVLDKKMIVEKYMDGSSELKLLFDAVSRDYSRDVDEIVSAKLQNDHAQSLRRFPSFNDSLLHTTSSKSLRKLDSDADDSIFDSQKYIMKPSSARKIRKPIILNQSPKPEKENVPNTNQKDIIENDNMKNETKDTEDKRKPSIVIGKDDENGFFCSAPITFANFE